MYNVHQQMKKLSLWSEYLVEETRVHKVNTITNKKKILIITSNCIISLYESNNTYLKFCNFEIIIIIFLIKYIKMNRNMNKMIFLILGKVIRVTDFHISL